jgi:hypothetical protein
MEPFRYGFLLVRTFDYLYRSFPKPAPRDQIIYSVPREGVPPNAVSKRYRGIDREALEAWSAEDLSLGFPYIPTPTEPEACIALYELECQGACETDFIFSLPETRRVYALLRAPIDWELIWAADVTADITRPREGRVLGYEPTWFWGDHFSAICDSMCFPRWHGTDEEEGTLFAPYYTRLNDHALFDSPVEAEDFLRFYRSQDWTETGDYVIAEIWWLPP